MKTTRFLVAAIAMLAVVGAAFAGTSPAHVFPQHLLQMPQLDADTLTLMGFGGLVLNRGNVGAFTQAFNAAFKQGMELVKPSWQEIAMLVPSTTAEEKYGWLGMTTKFREWIGERVVQNLKQYDYTIKNKTWEDTFSIPREAVEDDQFGIYKPIAQQLGQDAMLHPDELVYGLLQAGFSSICYDGQYFFDTDHPVGTGDSPASVSNFGGGAGRAWYLIDNSKILKPIIYQKRRDYAFTAKTKLDDDNVFDKNEFVFGADGRSNVGFGLWQLAYASKQMLDITNYTAARAAMMSLKSDSGKPLAITPKLLVVAPQDEKVALDLVTAEKLANGASNTMQNTARVMVCPWLA